MSTISNVAGSVRVIVFRFGRSPEVALIEADSEGSYLAAMQSIVGGDVERVPLEDGLELWANEDRTGLPLHMIIPARAPELPEGFEVIAVEGNLAAPGALGEWHIHGDCFLARDVGGRIADVTDTDVERWLERWLGAACILMTPAPDLSPFDDDVTLDGLDDE